MIGTWWLTVRTAGLLGAVCLHAAGLRPAADELESEPIEDPSQDERRPDVTMEEQLADLTDGGADGSSSLLGDGGASALLSLAQAVTHGQETRESASAAGAAFLEGVPLPPSSAPSASSVAEACQVVLNQTAAEVLVQIKQCMTALKDLTGVTNQKQQASKKANQEYVTTYQKVQKHLQSFKNVDRLDPIFFQDHREAADHLLNRTDAIDEELSKLIKDATQQHGAG